MYVCPICKKQRFEAEELLSKHYLKCWKEQHPYHQPKPAPRSEDINTVEIDEDILNFFRCVGDMLDGRSND